MTLNPSVLAVNHCTVLNIIVCLLQIIAFSHSSGCPADTLPCMPSAVSVERSGPENAAWCEFNLQHQSRLVRAVLWLALSLLFYELQDGRGILVSCRDITALCAHKWGEASCYWSAAWCFFRGVNKAALIIFSIADGRRLKGMPHWCCCEQQELCWW